jgi:hypothetical protein
MPINRTTAAIKKMPMGNKSTFGDFIKDRFYEKTANHREMIRGFVSF